MIDLLLLLVFGHLLGEFVIPAQEWDRSGPPDRSHLAKHGATVLAFQLLAVVPFLSLPIVAVLLVLTVLHIIIDILSRQTTGDEAAGLKHLFIDQILHFTVLTLAAWLSLHWEAVNQAVTASSHGFVDPWRMATLLAAGYSTAVFAGGVLVSRLLASLGLASVKSASPRTGKVIGYLERFIGLTLVLVGEWSALGLLLAAKSIARFRELDDREFGEYYLIGTLASLGFAMIVGLCTRRLMN
jgi:hypothetical protein